MYKKGQSILEYSILLCVILSALLVMQFYIKRGYQGNLKYQADQVGQQYSPGHTDSKQVFRTESIAYSYTGGGDIADALVKRWGLSASNAEAVAGGYTMSRAIVKSTNNLEEKVDSFVEEAGVVKDK